MKSKFFSAETIAENTICITGFVNDRCYLIEGGGRALLIDSATGVGNIRAFCRELTDLPLTLVNTHGHVDHAGGNFDFDECYIHPEDMGLMYESCSRKHRVEHVKRWVRPPNSEIPVMEEDFTELKPIKTFPLTDGYVFDLGGRCVEALALSGHTKGSTAFLDRSARMVFSGDACNANTLIFFPESASIEEYRKSLLRLKEFQPYFDVIYSAHDPAALPREIIDEAVELCGEIMNGTDDAVQTKFTGRPCYYAKKYQGDFKRLDGKIINIAYDRDKIFHIE
jgi:glyoxylase-like metal-dependent hydrolase (beta-lactamase superfamily II)